MPVPTVTCAICGEQVTKRASLALKNLDPKRWPTGRACRTHEEVQKLVATRMADDELNRKLKQAEFAICVIAAVSFVRVVCSFQGVSSALAMPCVA